MAAAAGEGSLERLPPTEVTGSITGHATAAMTDRYSHVDASEKAAAVASMLKLVHESGEKAGGGDSAA